MDITEMKQNRAGLVKQARDLLDKAYAEKRDMTAEEETQYEKYMTDVDKIGDQIEKEERLQDLEKEMTKLVDEPVKPDPGENRNKNPYATKEYREAFNGFLKNGVKGMETKEIRALQVDQDIYGGYLVAPEQFVMELIKELDNEVFIRTLATTYQIDTAESLGAPALDNDPADPDWTEEISEADEDSTMSIGKRNLYPHPLSKLIKVSRTLLRKSRTGAEALVKSRLAYKFGTTEENAFLNGSENNSPLGVFTASNNGIPSSSTYDISTANTSSTPTADGLINCKYALKAQYWKKAVWIFHRDIVKLIRKLKTGEGDYIWRPGIANDAQDTILEIPYRMSEYAPNTIAASAYVGILGDFSYYWIADALDMEIQRLEEKYATTNQVGFIGRKETDGMPVLAAAFRRVKLGS